MEQQGAKMGQPKFRHEMKYFINTADYIVMKNRIKHLASIDPNAGANGIYNIRSLYYDNIYNKAYIEKINGLNEREKFRIRFYNHDPDFIRLEKKSKTRGLSSKLSEAISIEECKMLINNDTEWMHNSGKELLQEFYAKTKYQMLKPKTIVEYKREAYIYVAGNVRVTFDTCMRSGLFSKDFLNKDIPTLSMSPENQIILEVKFDNFLPGVIQDFIQLNKRQATAISKYVYCRTF